MRDLTNGLATASADPNLYLREVGAADLKYYGASFAGAEMDSPESYQLPDRIVLLSSPGDRKSVV